jgi:hypothetical protein
MPTFLQGIAKKAQAQPQHRFGSLYELLNEEFLHECWRDIRKDAAYGVDRVSAKDYEQNLDANIHDLVERLKRKQYRAKLVRRQYIPKGYNQWRPLGIPAVEDKLLQLAVTRILQAIYEQDFLRCSYGYRPNVGPLGQRLGQFGLELSADKTRVIPFSQHQALGKTSFDFLGFEFRWGKDRAGKPHLKRRTSRKKLRNSLKQFTLWCQEKCRYGLEDLFRELNAKLRGYYNYYGVNGNYASLNEFFHSALRILFKWLNRRSQRRSYTWTGFRELLQFFQIEQPYLVGRPKPRKAAAGA